MLSQPLMHPSIVEPTGNSNDDFRRRRMANLLAILFSYSAIYTGRYNLSFANLALSKHYNFDKTQIGAIISATLAVYGISAFLNGPITDQIGGRRAMLMSMIGTVAFNVLFGLGAYLGLVSTPQFLIIYFATIWSLNAYFQSFGALAVIKINANWYHVEERGWFSAMFGIIVQSGRGLIYAIGPMLVVFLPWQWVFFVPAILIAGLSIIAYKVIANAPEDCGHEKLDIQDASVGDPEKVSVGYVLKKVFTNPIMLTIACAELCTGFVRHGFEQWFPRYMSEHQRLAFGSGVFQKGALAVVVAGICGAVLAGFISDRWFRGRRTPVACLGYTIQAISLTAITVSDDLRVIMMAFVANSFAISMVHSMLSGVASMDFGGRKAAGTAAGVFDGMQYIGGSFVGVGMGYLIENWGWSAWSPSMIAAASAGVLLMAILWKSHPSNQRSVSQHKTTDRGNS